MRRALLTAALALAAGCKMPAIPAGYQLVCDADDECPSGQVCSMNCCVGAGEAPSCAAASGIGTGCTGGLAASDGGGMPGSCPAYLDCFSEWQTGLVGGLCSLECSAASGCGPGESDCTSVKELALPWQSLCLRRCTARTGPSTDCRPGWSCGCDGDAGCHCLPACTSSGSGSCAPAPDGGAMRCVAQTGRCQPPLPGLDAAVDAGPVAGMDGSVEALDAGTSSGEDAGPPDARNMDATAFWSPPMPSASPNTPPGETCDNFCSQHGASCSEQCNPPGSQTPCGALSMSAGKLAPRTCQTDWSTIAGADHFQCCCTPFSAWTQGCTAVSPQVGSCTEYCASNGEQACADTCALEPGGPDLAGARAWSLNEVPSCCYGGCPASADQGYTCDHRWGDSTSTPARWNCCCL